MKFMAAFKHLDVDATIRTSQGKRQTGKRTSNNRDVCIHFQVVIKQLLIAG